MVQLESIRRQVGADSSRFEELSSKLELSETQHRDVESQLEYAESRLRLVLKRLQESETRRLAVESRLEDADCRLSQHQMQQQEVWTRHRTVMSQLGVCAAFNDRIDEVLGSIAMKLSAPTAQRHDAGTP